MSKEYSIAELAKWTGHRVTSFHKRPGENGMETWAKLDGRTVKTVTIRSLLEHELERINMEQGQLA